MDITRERRILHLLEDDPSLILLLKNKYVTETMWKTCIQQEPRLFRYNKNPSEELCYLALEEDGSNLEYLVKHTNIAITKKMAMVAIQSYPAAICYLKPNEVSDELKMYACLLDPTLLEVFPDLPAGFMDHQVLENPSLLQYIPNPSEELICNAIRRNPNTCAYVRTFTPRIKSLIRELYPEFITLIPALHEDEIG